MNCSATVAKFIAEAVNRSDILKDYPEIGTASFPSCTAPAAAWPRKARAGMLLQRTQWGYATHPNLGGALMVGLGCEAFQIDRMKHEYDLVEGEAFSDHDHPGHRRHTENDCRRRRAHQGDAAGRWKAKAQTRNCVRPPRSCWRCNAAAPTAIPASPPIRRSAPRSISLVSFGGTTGVILARNARGNLRRRSIC